MFVSAVVSTENWAPTAFTDDSTIVLQLFLTKLVGHR